MRRLEVGGLVLEVTDDQVADLRRQLGGSSDQVSDGSLVDSAAAARLMGVSPEYARDHAVELGGVKLGKGPKARWRFDPAKLKGGQNSAEPSAEPEAQSRPKRRLRKPGDGGLLEVRGETV